MMLKNTLVRSATVSVLAMFLMAGNAYAGNANDSLSNLTNVAINTALLEVDGVAANAAYSFTNDATMGLWRGPSDNEAALNSLHVAGGTDQTIDLEGYVELPTGELEADQSISVLSPGSGSFALTVDGPQAWTSCLDRDCTTDVVAPSPFAGEAVAYFNNTTHRLMLSNDGGAYSAVLIAGDHYSSTGPASSNAGTGTCSSVTVSGTDTRGTITATCTAGQTVIMDFGSAYASAPKCTISPDNANAIMGAAYDTKSTTAMTLTATLATVGSASWDYVCIE